MKSVLLGLVVGGMLTGCIVKNIVRADGPRLTGTCEGACDHYVGCKPGHPAADSQRCLAECPGVFADSDSLMMFESLSCTDAVEFVDGSTKATASAMK
jgi:hypothetical protein